MEVHLFNIETALHLESAALVDRAVASGWRADEVLTTIIALGDNHALMLAAKDDLEAALSILRKRP
ncbi:hypothetical protein ELH27_34865 [Rhizobium leguminosarum]|uniref:Uncharacterized protein n=1 Tax=Rhizobium beringeri TaxID=3019934 RepID=A0ABY1XI84_9HYPH|nr:hypothetical protein ELH27_34865 [Rhizobium leguminosarum]TBC91856.1 hypothetical protein ELH21_26990 [Rhizobium leguminosarum]TBE58249.1 hypothetical protein ELH03_35020 [Rhizobium beringeri]